MFKKTALFLHDGFPKNSFQKIYRYKQPFSFKRNTDTKKDYTDRGIPWEPLPPFFLDKDFTEVVVVDLEEHQLRFVDPQSCFDRLPD